MKICNNETGPDVIQELNEDIVGIMQKKINGHWPIIKNSSNFPGPQPISLELKDVSKLAIFPYVVCEKTDGMRFLLYMTKINNKPNIFLVDRAFRFYKICLGMKKTAFKESILDGELVQENNGPRKGLWTFYIHDCVILEGKNCSKDNFTIRYSYMTKICNLLYIPTEKDTFFISTKHFWNFDGNFNQVIEYYNDQSRHLHKIDGLVFTPHNLGISTGTQMSLFKWKELHTIDFYVKRLRGIRGKYHYDLYVSDRIQLRKHMTLNERTGNGRLFHQKFTELIPNYNSPVIIECSFIDGKYIPLVIRDDKTYPNSVRTVEKTYLNMRENITLEYLKKLSV